MGEETIGLMKSRATTAQIRVRDFGGIFSVFPETLVLHRDTAQITLCRGG